MTEYLGEGTPSPALLTGLLENHDQENEVKYENVVDAIFAQKSFQGIRSAHFISAHGSKTWNQRFFDQQKTGWWDVRDGLFQSRSDLVVLVLRQGDGSRISRKIFAGRWKSTKWSKQKGGNVISVDKWRLIDTMDGAGRFREYMGGMVGAINRFAPIKLEQASSAVDDSTANSGFFSDYQQLDPNDKLEVQRQVMMRGGAYRRYVAALKKRWWGKCAVYGETANGLLVASHIKPWSQSTDEEKIETNNGLLLSAPLDRLFDQGLISFQPSGHIAISSRMNDDTKRIFALRSDLSLRLDCLTNDEKNGVMSYLAIHRETYEFPTT